MKKKLKILEQDFYISIYFSAKVTLNVYRVRYSFFFNAKKTNASVYGFRLASS